MTYETAPATKLVATHCCVCGRPLVEADSVETGIGPVCAARTKYGHASHDPDMVRVAEALAGLELSWLNLADPHKAANQLVHRIAADQSNPLVPRFCAAVDALGYTVLAEVLVKRLAPVVVEVKVEANTLVLTTEFKNRQSPLFGTLLTALRGVQGRRWDGERKANLFPLQSKRSLWSALKSALPAGSVVCGTRLVTL